MHEEIRELREQYQRLQGQKDQIFVEIGGLEKRARLAKRWGINCERGLIIVQTVAQQTQKELEYKIAELASLAMSTVYSNPYEVKTEFVIRANRTEVDIFFERDGERRDPFGGSGGGPIDIAAFALRLALWNLSRPKTRNAIVLDEPFRFVSVWSQKKSSEMLRVLSQKLNLQIIMTSHNEAIIGASHRIFELDIKRGITRIVREVDQAKVPLEEKDYLTMSMKKGEKNGNDKNGRKRNDIKHRTQIKRGTIPATRRRRTTPIN